MNSAKWNVVWVCFALLFLLAGTQMTFAVLLLPMAKEFRVSVSVLALAVTICMLVTALSLPIVGRLTDKYGPRATVLTGGGIAGVSTLLMAYTSSVWQTYLLYGCFFGFTWNSCGTVASTALVSRSFSGKRSVAMTAFQTAFPLGWLFMIPLAQEIRLIYGWRNSWLVFGASILSIVCVASYLLKEPKSVDRQRHGRVGLVPRLGVSTNTTFFLIIGVAIQFICGFTDVPLSTHWIPISLEWGIGDIVASLALSSLAAVMLVGTAFLGLIQARIGKKIPFTIAYVVRTAALTVPLLARSTMTYYVFVVLLGFSFYGMMPILSTWLGEVFGETSVGSLLGISLLVHSIGAGVGVYFFSLSADISGAYRPAFAFGVILALISVVCCLLTTRAERNVRHNSEPTN